MTLRHVFLVASQLELDAVADPSGARPCLARLGPFALTHRGHALESTRTAAPLLEALRRIAPAPSELDATASGVDLARALEDALLPARVSIRFVRSEVDGLTLATPPWRLRDVPLDAPRRALPLDPERIALFAGLRDLIKREHLHRGDADAQRAALERDGLRTALVDTTVLAARSEAVLSRGVELERRLVAPGRSPTFADDATAMGALLGYPRCCIEAYLAHHRHDDATLVAARYGSFPRVPVELHALSPLALFSHLPCVPACSATFALARATFAAAFETDGVSTAAGEAWRRAASSVVLVAASGASFRVVLDEEDRIVVAEPWTGLLDEEEARTLGVATPATRHEAPRGRLVREPGGLVLVDGSSRTFVPAALDARTHAASDAHTASETLRVGFLVPFAHARGGYFPDTLLAELAADSEERGFVVRQAEAYYDGQSPTRDRAITSAVAAWLERERLDVVVVDRLFDPASLAAWRAHASTRRVVLVARGDTVAAIDGVDLVIGAFPAPRSRSSRARPSPRALPTVAARAPTRRVPTARELADAMGAWLRAHAVDPHSADTTHGVESTARVEAGELVPTSATTTSADTTTAAQTSNSHRPYRARLGAEVLALEPPPPVTHRTLHGNAGCPYARDPSTTSLLDGVALPTDAPIARLGCSFCGFGGDYAKRPDDELLPELVDAARFWTSAEPALTALVLSDQYAQRYLAKLVRAAHAAGLRPLRWLFPSRVDTLLRERASLEAAIAEAAATGQCVELYLAGFESFCDRELERYNKGYSVDDALEAVALLRALQRANPRSFAYADARGHSLILWNPWTRPEDVAESLDTIRAHGLTEFFHDLGHNRLRLYPDLPLYYAAERDALLTDSWDERLDGQARAKGYSVEHPWRFLDPRSDRAFSLARALQRRLGRDTELAQLRAAVDASIRAEADRGDDALTAARVAPTLEALDQRLATLARRHPRSTDGVVVTFAGACNQGCVGCAQRDRWLDDAPAALELRVDAARDEATRRDRSRAETEPRTGIVLAGREPTIHRAFLALVQRARGDDDRPVAIVTNGRAFALRGFAAAATRAGLRAASLKLFGASADVSDAYTRTPGAWAQTLAGGRALTAAGVSLEVRVLLHRALVESPAELDAIAALAASLGAHTMRLEVALDALGIDRLDAASDSILRLERLAAPLRLAVEAAHLADGTTSFRHYPFATKRR